LTEERRKDLVKKLHKSAEETKVSIRTHRREMIDALKKRVKEKEISEDDLHRAQAEIQKITDKYTAEVDVILAAKEKEMMEV
jgi:ribosome recycling factor